MNIIDNRYKIVKEFVNNNIINTYLVEDIENNDNKLILKRLIVSEISDWKIVELFERESEILKYLDHVGIAKYIEAKHLTEDGEEIFYLVQEYIEGKSLKEFIEKGIPLSENDIFNITQELLEILDYLSNLVPPIIHRDIKPSNIMIREDKSVVLIDFGAINNVSSMNSKDITVVGTAGFMAPEQLMGHATIQSDLYSVGTTLINLLTRINPATLPIIDMKIQFRRDTGFNTFFKNFIDELIHPQTKYRIKTPKKALKYLEKVRNGKFGRDVFAIPKDNEVEKDQKDSNKSHILLFIIISFIILFLAAFFSFLIQGAS